MPALVKYYVMTNPINNCLTGMFGRVNLEFSLIIVVAIVISFIMLIMVNLDDTFKICGSIAS